MKPIEFTMNMIRANWRASVSVIIAILWALVLYGYLIGAPFSQKLAVESISPNTGFGYSTKIAPPALASVFRRKVDTQASQSGSRARLFENDVSLQPAHSVHDEIRTKGQGRFSDWDGSLYFSTSDNTDPRVNGRQYELRDNLILAKKPGNILLGVLGIALITIWLVILPWRKIPSSILEILKRPEVRNGLLALVAFSGIGLALLGWASKLYGVPFWLALVPAVIFGLLALKKLLAVIAGVARVSWELSWFSNLALILVSVGICLVGFESYLAFLEAAALQPQTVTQKSLPQASPLKSTDSKQDQYEPVARERRLKDAIRRAGLDGDAAPNTTAPTDDQPTIGGIPALPPQLRTEMKRRRELLSLPEEWQRKMVEVPNTRWAYAWHGVIHIHDDNKFRRFNGPFPAKRSDTMRVMVVGDSMTYGAGIQPEWTYTAQLERALQKDYRIEFFNLGVNGDQSEDVEKSIEHMLPILKPDLVIYGFCYNDFLPSGIGQYENNHIFPLPKVLKDFLLGRSRLAHFVDDGYQALLLKLGVSLDFYDDILKNLKGYQKRFSNDVTQMNQACHAVGLPPIVAMPLDQNVVDGGRGHHISQLGEKLMREAGFDVISLDGYYKRYNGRSFTVSRWEGHPDEEANAIFASMLYDHLRLRADIQRYARSDSTNSGRH